jgi:hypothetical protein
MSRVAMSGVAMNGAAMNSAAMNSAAMNGAAAKGVAMDGMALATDGTIVRWCIINAGAPGGTYQESCPLGVLELSTFLKLTSI